jgi:riboflavin-specific deaminase-like protein
VEVLDLLGRLDLSERAPAERPYTVVNFVSSVDGRAAFQGRSGQLGDQTDREMFHGLREQADAVIAGTGTMRSERYGRLVPDAQRRERRILAGRTSEPLAGVVTRSGDLPADAPLFSEADARIVVFGPADMEVASWAAQVKVVRLDPGELTLTTAMRRLRADFRIRSVLCEGGPTLFSALLREHLVDELFLTLASKLAGGGSSPTITSGPELPELAQLNLVWALERAGSLYLRYSIER